MDSKDVGISNINCVGQIVVWVREGKDKKLEEYAKIKGAKRVIPLKVNGCLHSPYMEEVKEKLKETISQLDFKPPRFRLIMNVSGKEENDPQVIKRLLWEQVSSPVQWLKSAENLIKNGVDEVVEVGASNVLSGIMLRINKEWKVWSYNSKIK
jgi:[acyl-carrier-protein] S-malonyltransferase